MHEITIVLKKDEDINGTGLAFLEQVQHLSDFPTGVMETDTIKVVALRGPWDHAMRLLNLQGTSSWDVETVVDIYVNESDD